MAKVLFFAQLREVLKQDELALDLDEATSVGALRRLLQQRFPDWGDLLAEGQAMAALNQELVDDDAVVNKGDEVAFFPPVTGG